MIEKTQKLATTAALSIFIFTIAMSCIASQYKLGPGDSLRIGVWGHEDLKTETTVRPDGVISFPLIGDCNVRGLTPQELAAELELRLATYIKRPAVTVSVQQFRQIQVQVLGEVVRPGTYSLIATSKASQAIAAAGGLQSARAAATANLTRQGKTVTFAVDKPGQGEELSLEDGDLIYVPTKPQVTVLGEVARPGLYLIDKGTRLSELLAQAGGTSSLADQGQAQLIRKGQAIPLTRAHFSGQSQLELLDKDTLFLPPMPQIVLRGEVAKPGTYRLPVGTTVFTALALAGDLTEKADPKQITLSRQGKSQILDLTAGGGEIQLLADDRLEIPRGRREVLVLGQVRTPGSYLLPPRSSVLDAIALAGGTTDKAQTEKIRIYSKGDLDTQQVLALGQDRLLFEGELSANPALGEGDIVFIPESKRLDWVKLGTVLGVFKILQEIFIGK